MVRPRCARALKLGYRLTFERCEDRRPLSSDAAVLLLPIGPDGPRFNGTTSDAGASVNVESTAPGGRSAGVGVGLPAGPSAYLADVVHAGSTNVVAEGQPVGPGVEASGAPINGASPAQGGNRRIVAAVPVNDRPDLVVKCPGLGGRFCLASGLGRPVPTNSSPTPHSPTLDLRFYRAILGDDRLGRAGRFVSLGTTAPRAAVVP